MSESECLSVCVCVCVCVSLSVRDHISGTTRPIFTRFFVRVTTPWLGPPLAAYCSDTLCTSGFTDDVIFTQKPRLLDVAAQLNRSAHAAYSSPSGPGRSSAAKTVLSCRVWRGGVNWTIAVNVFRQS